MSQPGENPQGMGLNQIWLTAPAGLAGVLLLVATELSGGPAHTEPVPRYAPPGYNESGLIAAPQDIAIVVAPTAAALEAAFARSDYDLLEIRRGAGTVPHLRLPVLPRDLPEMSDAGKRKELFLSLALPLILEANVRVAVERKRLLYVIEQLAAGEELPAEELDWLTRLADRYGTDPGKFDLLIRRVDTIPVSLALAQAAAESGWGTSRFAQRGNALFGQWTTEGGRGLVPHGRPQGQTHKVRSFERLIDSVSAYLRNLNTHRAYRDFRASRAEARSAGEPLDGMALAGELESYAETGEEYVELLRGMIRRDSLTDFDAATLGDHVIEFTPGV